MNAPEIHFVKPNPLLEAALSYAQMGWPVFPLHNMQRDWCSCGNAKCTPRNHAKHPRTRNGLLDATTDEGRIRGWWGTWPSANVGVITGPQSGLAVLDVDADHGGMESARKLFTEMGGDVPITPMTRTGSGGRHMLFAHSGVFTKSNSQALGPEYPGLDIKGDGGYIVAPPSRNRGGPYEWEPEFHPQLLELCAFPHFIRNLADTISRGRKDVPAPAEKIADGVRHQYLIRLGGAMRRQGASEDEMLAAFRAANENKFDTPAPDEHLVDRATDIARRYAPEHEPVLIIGKNGHKDEGPTIDEDGNIYDEWEPVRAWELSEPAPMRWFIENMLPEGFATTLFADGGSGKSYLGLLLSMLCCLGRSFGELAVTQCPVLYVDAELRQDVFMRRAYAVARGLGLDRPPVGLHYFNLRYSVAAQATQNRIKEKIDKLGVGLTVLDSLSIAAFGADPKEADKQIQVLKGLEFWGTMLVIDHVPGQRADANQSNTRPFGSVFKRNLARSAWRVIKTMGGGLALQHDKSNFGPLLSPIYLGMEFYDDKVVFEHVDSKDERMAGVEIHSTAVEQLYVLLQECGSDGASVLWLSGELEKKEKTIRNLMSVLSRQGRVKLIGNSLWAVTGPPTLSVNEY